MLFPFVFYFHFWRILCVPESPNIYLEAARATVVVYYRAIFHVIHTQCVRIEIWHEWHSLRNERTRWKLRQPIYREHYIYVVGIAISNNILYLMQCSVNWVRQINYFVDLSAGQPLSASTFSCCCKWRLNISAAIVLSPQRNKLINSRILTANLEINNEYRWFTL